MKFKVVVLSLVVALTASCSKMVEETIKNNPELVFKAIEAKPKEFFETIKRVQETARKQEGIDREKSMADQLESEFKNPKTPVIAANRAVFGNKAAPITIVEYSDFQCPYCAKAADIMGEVFAKYGDKVKLVYKHLPFKRNAEPAARYFEAIAMQDAGKAKKFHDILYANQQKINEGEPYFKEITKQVGADLDQVAKNLMSKEVTDRINRDKAEAQKFEITGTPGFVVGGVTVKGAYPVEHFVKIIDRLLKK